MVEFVRYILYTQGKEKILFLGDVPVCREVKPPICFFCVLGSLLFRIYCKLAAEGESVSDVVLNESGDLCGPESLAVMFPARSARANATTVIRWMSIIKERIFPMCLK